MMILTGNLLSNSLKLFGLIVLFCLIIVACYYVTRFVGTRSMGAIKEGNMKLIDSLRINQNQSIFIVRVGTRYFLLSSSKDSVRLLTELAGDDVKELSSGTGKSFGFQDILSSLTKKEPKEPKL